MTAQLKFDNPAGVAKPLGLYSHVAVVPAGTTLVFVSGQVPQHPDGSFAEGLAAQTEQVCTNLFTVLATHGIAPRQIVKLTTYLVDDDPDGVVSRIRSRYLGNHRPASTLIWVKRLADPTWKIEIEAVAAMNE